MTYPESTLTRLNNLAHCRELPGANAEGIGVNLSCGSIVRLFLKIDESGRVADAAFRSNGCGHSRAAADVIAEWVTNKQLADLHGLGDTALQGVIQAELGKILDENSTCVAAATSALKDTFANYRALRIEEFRGEKALICTCFGIIEERIEDIITKSKPTSVEGVTALSNAGAGCGSCRMLIQEMLDARREAPIVL